MYELIQVSPTAYYIDCPAKIGLVRLDDHNVCLIDSGSDKDAGKKVLKHLNANDWHLNAIYNTHSHADHIGGNAYLHSQTGCRIYAPGIEQSFTAHPILEPAYLYGGYPPKELHHKFLLAAESPAEPLTQEVLLAGLTLLPLPGHSFDMVGFRTADDVVFLADCLSSRETIDKYRIGFLYDVAAYLDTLEAIKTMSATLFVPSHAAPTTDIVPLAQYNIDTVNAIADRIVALCQAPITFEALLSRLFTDYALTITFQQHALVGSTVRSYLTYLATQGRIAPRFEENQLLWASL